MTPAQITFTQRQLELEMRLITHPARYDHYVHHRGGGDAGYGVWLWVLDTVAAKRVPGQQLTSLADEAWWRAAYDAGLMPPAALTQAVRNRCAGQQAEDPDD